MDTLLKYAPLINLGVLVVSWFVAMLLLKATVERIGRTLDRMEERLNKHESRLVRLETHCDIRHGHSQDTD